MTHQSSQVRNHAAGGRKGLRRLAATAVLTLAALTSAAQPAAAQTFGGGWRISAFASCYMGTHAASVSVSVQEPTVPTSGLYFYTELWAKARYETSWNRIKVGQTGLIKTWAGSYYGNTAKTIFTGSFYGNVRANYDIGIQYWFHGPNTTYWTGPFFFTLKADPDSSVMSYDAWGYGYRSVKDCSL